MVIVPASMAAVSSEGVIVWLSMWLVWHPLEGFGGRRGHPLDCHMPLRKSCSASRYSASVWKTCPWISRG